MQEININGSLCLKNRCDAVDCNVCISSCPTAAITINGRIIEMGTDECIWCGVCVSKCKTGVFSFADPETRDYLTVRYPHLIRNGNGLPFIICQKEAGDYSFLPDCIGMFSETDLAVAAIEIKEDIFLYGGDCIKCSGNNYQIIEKNIDSANKILSLFDVPWKIRKVHEWENLDLQNILENIRKREEERKSLSRRNFFNRLKVQSMNAAATVVLNENDKMEVSNPASIIRPRREKWVPSKRKKLFDISKGFDIKLTKQIEAVDFPFYKLVITDSCTLCNICSDFCPTGAIRKYEDGFETGLEFDILKCIRCTDCEKLCPQGAIEKQQYINAADFKNNSVIRMARNELAECVDCEMKFLPKDNEQKCRRCLKLEKMSEIVFCH